MSNSAEPKTKFLNLLGDILADIVDADSLNLSESTVADDVPGWDSINHVRLLLAIESEFGFRFDLNESEGLMNVGQLVEVIQKNLRDK